MGKLLLFVNLIIFFLNTFRVSGQVTHNNTSEERIQWEIPQDGGTPKDYERIIKVSDNRYRIKTSMEEGATVLKHAVSRMDLICRNNGTDTIAIILEIDLSQDGKRTDFDNRPEAGMKFRDFIFIRCGGGDWKQVNGKTKNWDCIVQFQLPPGVTQIGLSPWYTYADYKSFIDRLTANKYLQKTVLGKTDKHVDHYEITVTDTSVSAKDKKRIFWQAREHAYETFSSFAMEGLIAFLLSEEAAVYRRKYIFTIHPMTNIDGVAGGYEYRAGYDFPEPRTTQTAKLTFDAIDRLKPDYAVAWHNWIAPRDRNVVFYTDADSGKPSARAWLRFAQLFPSLRQWDHRWKDEATPIKYNWSGRSLTDVNVHQYAMNHYGTSIWGWEMPWWNVGTSEAMEMGASFARAFLKTITEIDESKIPKALKKPPISIRKYDVFEFRINATANVTNPWKDASLVGDFVSPSGKIKSVDGFYDGNDKWKLRFNPDEKGTWNYRLRGEGIDVLVEGVLICQGSVGHGMIRVHPENAYGFAHADTTAFFPMGDTNYGLLDDSPITPKLRRRYLTERTKQGFNFIRLEVGHSYAHAQKDSTWWAWGGSPGHPDFDRLNPEFFARLDVLLSQMRALNMNAEMILLNFYRLPFTNPKIWSWQREQTWIRYLIARYGAYSNIFLWTIANEYETHPDGKYHLDRIDDVEWAKRSAAFIRQNDPYHHLITIHPVISSSSSAADTRTPFQMPWRIGGFFGKDTSVSVLSQQTGQSGDGINWSKECGCWVGDDPYLTASIDTDRVYAKPVINTENGYEFLKGYPTMRRQVHHTDKVRRSSWRIVCAGGYFASGFSGTIGHSDVWNIIDAPHHYSFKVKDEGAGKQLTYLKKFFTSLSYWKMQPYKRINGNAVALADDDRTIVVYFPHGDRVMLYWSGKVMWDAQWFNPRTGKYIQTTRIHALDEATIKPPDTNDWVLLLKNVSPCKR